MEKDQELIRRTSPLILAVVLIMIALAAVSLYTAVELYTQGDEKNVIYYVTLGILGIGISVYTFMQGRRKIPVLRFEGPKVSTYLTCDTCDFRSVREFKAGDYIFKKADECPKCRESMTVTAIYPEMERGEKTA